ncbi:probable disease resistance protein RPP1 isoform X2 [Macadamia integrifolia]|nr:probable disease resistance protein RPP1 isoform X2 [Macadamia integrifolia]
MSKLRFLYIQLACFEGGFPHLPSSLRWFSWERYLLENVQDNFYHKKLVHMDISKSQIRRAWTNKPQNENQVGRCISLQKLLDLSSLTNLRELTLSNCKKLEEIRGQQGTESLEVFSLYKCNTIESLPELPSTLTSLVRSCISLQKLPDFSSLKNLRKLKLHDCESLEVIRGLGGTESLEEFSMYECNSIESLPELPSALTCLDVGSCISLQKLQDLSSLKNLRELRLHNCKNLEEIRGLEGTESLERFFKTITDTQSKILGQGTVLVDPPSISDHSLSVNDGIYKGLILCLVFALDQSLPWDMQRVLIYVAALIHRNDRMTHCDFEIKIEDLEFITGRYNLHSPFQRV